MALPQPLLSKLSALLSRPWLLDFFTKSAPTHISPNHAVTHTLSEVSYPHPAPPNLLPSHLSSCNHVLLSILQIPAFTADNITLGFGVFFSQADPCTTLPYSTAHYRIKYATDVTDGTYLIFRSQPSHYVLCMFVQLSPTRRILLELAIRKSSLHTLASSPPSLHGILSMLVVHQSGSCPRCATVQDSACLCPNPTPPTHPFDFHTTRDGGLRIFHGSFQGVGLIHRFQNGALTKQFLNVSTELNEGVKQTVKEDLMRWVVHIDPRMSLLPPPEPTSSIESAEQLPLADHNVQNQLDSILDHPDAIDVTQFSAPGIEEHQQAVWTQPLPLLEDAVEVKKKKRGKKQLTIQQEMDVLIRRHERSLARMERNRESARRSNLKRKMRNEKARDEMNFLKEREEQLRKRETELRAENLTLRQAIANGFL